MHHIDFGSSNATYPIALLFKPSALNKDDLIKYYIEPLIKLGITGEDVVAFSLDVQGKKVTAAVAKAYLDKLMPAMEKIGVKYLYVTDGEYFKAMTKCRKAEGNLGYALPCSIKGYEHMTIVLGVNYQQLIYNPAVQEKLDQSLIALASYITGTYVAPGADIIHEAVYPEGSRSIREALEALLEYEALTCDIEAFSLRFWEAGIGTIAFAPDQHRFVAFPVDYEAHKTVYPEVERRVGHGRNVPNPEIRAHLKWFFENYKGKLIFHNANYDVKVLIYVLFMESLLDTKGLLYGMETLCRNVEDTKIISYLATNSTAGNVLGLKPLAHEFAGNWAVEDIKDIRLIPLHQLLQYNGVDSLSTWYVFNKYTPVMVTDQQENLYRSLMLPSMRLILQIELTGMPMSKKKIAEGKAKLQALQAKYEAIIRAHPLVAKYEELATDFKWEKDWEDRKFKAKNPDKIKPKDRGTFPRHEFNPNSGDQVRDILYDSSMMDLPVIDLTDSGQAATGGDTLEKLLNHTQDASYKEFIEAIMDFSEVSKILSTFIPAFEGAINKDPSNPDVVWLHGSLNLGGTVSGRLSSSDPNLQNLPAKSTFAKLIKEMFIAPEGWLFGGADFNSLEDMISALTTKDKNKLKVYTDGFDGHALRACYYFKEDLEKEGIHVDLSDPKSVNSLKKMGKDGHWTRQASKAPTFLLTYGGTYHGLMNNLGWPKEMSIAIEANYHNLYQESDRYVERRLEQATHDGYVTVAFGLRVRTPLLAQVVWGSSRMPNEAKAEGRTAGNAMGQSYGLLNNRAAVDFMQKVWASKYRYDIKPSNLIHDAIYIVWRDDAEVTEWVNRELIESMRWQELEEIKHDTVKLGAALDIFWPSWANAITLPNDCDQDTIINMCEDAANDYYYPKEKIA
jgi:DNA polymerase-1